MTVIQDLAPHEFRVDLEGGGQGTLIVTDLQLMLRPAAAGQLYARSPHDEGRIAAIMSLGEDDRSLGEDDRCGFGPTWHIATHLGAEEAAGLMRQAWHAYFNGYCMGKIWIDATVQYLGADGMVLRSEDHGFSDGEEVGVVKVYCREFWQALHDSGDPVQADWTPLLNRAGLELEQPTRLDQLEERLAAGVASDDTTTDRVVVVRPADDPLGYSARGFELIQL